ncbi:ryncolin-4-like [Argopecten irradians]|uniref:ryncolin-4-like n=1 Tax=Argopecten irradians TaxID=31199 RepID=UPI0037120418
METDGGGWTVFQTRLNGALNFNKKWMEYKIGFGKPEGEFWLGNDVLHYITSRSTYELRIDVTDVLKSSGFAVYKHFHIGSSETNYHLSVADYSGNIADVLSNQTGKQFSTFDADNDEIRQNCAFNFKGGWWYGDCGTRYVSYLNSQYTRGSFTQQSQGPGIIWYEKEYQHFLEHTQMMIRRQ